MTRQTHTFAVLEVSQTSYAEIRGKLAAAGYQHAFMDDGAELIDMHGVALQAEVVKPRAVAEIEYVEIDPGIRVIVQLLRMHGFETTDSGDGVSKPAAWFEPNEHGITEALPFPHVVAVTSPSSLLEDAAAMQDVLDAYEPGVWRVEATYVPQETPPTAVLMAVKDLYAQVGRPS